MTFRVYVAAPYADAGLVREVHERLLGLGVDPTSSWAEIATGKEDFSLYDETKLRAFAAQNDHDLDGSDAVLVLARAGAGGEMFAEAARGLMHGLPLFWVGRRTLSAWRQGVTRCDDLDEAIDLLARAAEGR